MDNLMTDKIKPIGVFDSGLGGLSVVRTMQTLLPTEDIIYFGDSLHAPYGTKSKSQVKTFSHACTERLIKENVKAIVIACNTATSAAASSLRKAYDMPIIGMEPALKPATDHYPNGNILVLATDMTLREEKFSHLMRQYRQKAHITLMPAGEFVTLVEGGELSQSAVDGILNAKLSHKDYDAVILGCTHFIFLKQYIDAYFNEDIAIFDGNEGTVKHLRKQLMLRHQLNTDMHTGKLTIYNSAGEEMVKKSHHLLKALG